MELLWVLVVVGVVGGVTGKMHVEAVQPFGNLLEELIEESRLANKEREACRREFNGELCRKGFLFTLTALNEVRRDGELEVVLSLERSLHPHVTFHLSFRSSGDEDSGEEILVRERVTLEANELRRVVLRVSHLPWKTAYLSVTAYPTGHPEIDNHAWTHAKIRRENSVVFVQTEKSTYAPGDAVHNSYRVVFTTPKFAKVQFYRSLFRVNLLSVETLSNGNSSHPQATVVLQFLVERRDGGSVEEEEPSKGLQVRILLSEENLKRLRPTATNFSLPIPPNGVVRLEWEVNSHAPSPRGNGIRVEVSVADEQAGEAERSDELVRRIHVTPVEPARIIRRGDVVRFHVWSCVPYGSVNAIFASSNSIYASQRFSFTPHGGTLDQVIDLKVPRNVSEGSLTLTVYGLSTNLYANTKKGDITSLTINLVPAYGPQNLRIVDQVDGILADSVGFLQAAKMESPGGYFEEIEQDEQPMTCHRDGYLGNRKNAEGYSMGDGYSEDVHISANFDIGKKKRFARRSSLVFFDFDRKTSTQDKGTPTVTKKFDRLTEFGTHVISGATFNSKSGRTALSNSPLLTILPSPVTLSGSAPTSAALERQSKSSDA